MREGGQNDEDGIGRNTYLCSGPKELVFSREVYLIFNYITNTSASTVNRLYLYIFDIIERLLDRNRVPYINLAQLSYCNCVATRQCVLCQIE